MDESYMFGNDVKAEGTKHYPGCQQSEDCLRMM